MSKTNSKTKTKKRTLAQRVEALEKNHRTILSNVARGFTASIDGDKKRDERITALESRLPAPVEPEPKWVPKVGDILVITGPACLGTLRLPIGSTARVNASIDGEVRFEEHASFYTLGNVRPATEAEIAAHLEAEEQRKRKEDEAAEIAKPLEFGTRVKYGKRDDAIWMGVNGLIHEVAFSNGNGTWKTAVCDRSDFVILPNK